MASIQDPNESIDMSHADIDQLLTDQFVRDRSSLRIQNQIKG